jgi:hypothetical protein
MNTTTIRTNEDYDRSGEFPPAVETHVECGGKVVGPVVSADGHVVRYCDSCGEVEAV